MRWQVHGERMLYTSEWVELVLADVEVPGGPRFDHHVVRIPSDAAGTVVHDPERGVLLLWRHRFITDTWGYEVPAGRVDPGEAPIAAARREVREETGWEPGPLTPLTTYHPVNGTVDVRFHLFRAAGARRLGPPADASEAERVEWVPVQRLPGLLAGGQVLDGMSVTGLLWFLQQPGEVGS